MGVGVYLMVFTDFAEAQAAAEAAGQVVLGLVRTGEAPTYRIVPAELDDTSIRNTAFEYLHGRPMSEGEEYLLQLVESRAVKD